MSTATPRPRLTLRSPRREDLEAVTSLVNRYCRAFTGADCTSSEVISVSWSRPHFDLGTDARVLLDEEDQIVGYCRSKNSLSPHETNDIELAVDPDAFPEQAMREPFSALLAWADERARERLNRAPPDARVVNGTMVDTNENLLRNILEETGYQEVRRLYRMTVDLPQPPRAPERPEGISVRSFADYPDFLRPYRALREAFRDHVFHVETPEEDGLASLRHRFATDSQMDPNLCVVLVDGDEIAASAVTRRESDEDRSAGYIIGLGVRRPWRRRGLGTVLLIESFRRIYQAGKRRAMLHVDTDNITGATRVYERAGMVNDRTILILEKEIRPGRELRKMS